MLQLENVVCRYGKVEAIKSVSLEVNKGELVTVIGANGAGKSSTLKAISGLLPPVSGRILFEGEDITHASPQRILSMGIAHCPEGRRVFPQMTIQENLEIGAYRRKDAAGIASDMEKIFNDFPKLKERRLQAAGTLSGGEQQMLAIARAMMAKPRMILLDEPSEGIMPLLVHEMFELFARMKQQGTTLLLVEQNVERALSISDRAYILDQGRIVHQGAAADLLADREIQDRYCAV